MEFLNFGEIKPLEAQGELRGESLISLYASTLPLDTFLVIKEPRAKRIRF